MGPCYPFRRPGRLSLASPASAFILGIWGVNQHKSLPLLFHIEKYFKNHVQCYLKTKQMNLTLINYKINPLWEHVKHPHRNFCSSNSSFKKCIPGFNWLINASTLSILKYISTFLKINAEIINIQTNTEQRCLKETKWTQFLLFLQILGSIWIIGYLSSQQITLRKRQERN